MWQPATVTWHGDNELIANNLSLIERTDISRYVILYNHGGAYADADVQLMCDNPFPCRDTIYVEFPGRWGGLEHHYAQFVFSASRQAPWLSHVLKFVRKAVNERKRCQWRDVLWRTGPKVFSAAVDDFIHGQCTYVAQGRYDCGTFPLCIEPIGIATKCFSKKSTRGRTNRPGHRHLLQILHVETVQSKCSIVILLGNQALLMTSALGEVFEWMEMVVEEGGGWIFFM